MRVGIDFDNTIACYGTIFHRAATDRGLVPPHPALTKSQVRDLLRRMGREDDWTELQGFVYGPGMAQVEAFPGMAASIRRLRDTGAEVFVISHRTRTPYRGPAHDLHAAAWDWLRRQGFFDAERIGLREEDVYFETRLGDKLQRIAERRCTHFVDDLPELLAEPNFPAGVERILFDPDDAYAHEPFPRIRTWAELTTWIEQSER